MSTPGRLALSPPGTLRASKAAPKQVHREGWTYWSFLAVVWAAYYVAVLTLGRSPAFNRYTGWVGGGLAFLLTIIPLLRRSSAIPTEAWVALCFGVWGLLGIHLVWDWPQYIRHMQMILQLIVVVGCLGLVIRQSGAVHWMFIAFILVGIYNVLFGLGDAAVWLPESGTATAIDRNAGLAGNANSLGFYGFLGVFGALAILGISRSWIFRAVLLATIPINAYCVVASASRGALLTLVLGWLLWGFLCMGARLRNRAVTLCVVLVVGLAAYLFVTRVVMESTYLGSRVEQGARLEDSSSRIRYELVMSALELAARHPLQGVGVGQFAVASGFSGYTHTELAELLSTTGIPGFLLYSSIYLLSWLRIQKALGQTRDGRVHYYGNLGRVILIVLVVSGALFRQNYLAFDGLFLTAMAVGLSEWTAARAAAERQADPRKRPKPAGATRQHRSMIAVRSIARAHEAVIKNP